jgi:superfamily II DNA or RNA helicase
MKRIKINKKTGLLELKFLAPRAEWQSLLNNVKSLDERIFIPSRHIWTCPNTKENLEKLTRWGFEIDDIDDLQEFDEKTIAENIQKEINKIKFKSDILYDYQIEHVKKLLYAYSLDNDGILDASQTGTGKTFCALAIAKHLNLFPIIITPKSVISSWKNVAKMMGVKCYVNNYEQYRTGKIKYLIVNENIFDWNLNDKHLLIYDEAHKIKNKTTINARIAIAAKKTGCKILCLSATIADSPLQMYALGQLLNLFIVEDGNDSGFWQWARSKGVYKGIFGMEFSSTNANLNKIHNEIFPRKGARIRIQDLGDKFPDNLIITDCYDMGSSNEIQKIYDDMYHELERLREQKQFDKASELVVMLRARQEIELLKVPTFVELANDAIEEGSSVVIFVNFKETIKALSERLKTDCIIEGSVSGEEREKNINDFQTDISRIIICNIRAGGVGISLHHIESSKYPRISIISPTYSAQDLVQALGRIHRAGGKSKAIQKIIFAAGTIEEKVSKKVQKKIKNIERINDGDMGV